MRAASFWSNRQGFTLAELSVVLFLMGVVLLLVAELLVPSTMLFAKASASADSQQAAWVFLHRMEVDVSNTVPDTLTVVASPPALALQPLRADGSPFNPSTGDPLFDNHFEIFVLDAGQHVVWLKVRQPRGVDFGDGSKPQHLDPTTLATVCGDSQPGDRVLCRNVTALSFGPTNPPLMPLPVQVTCAAPPAVPGKPPPEAWQISTRLSCRNTLW